jgi:hypothetical protein
LDAPALLTRAHVIRADHQDVEFGVRELLKRGAQNLLRLRVVERGDHITPDEA